MTEDTRSNKYLYFEINEYKQIKEMQETISLRMPGLQKPKIVVTNWKLLNKPKAIIK